MIENRMITFEEAYNIVKEHVFRTGTEEIRFEDALGRVLAMTVRSDVDMPPWNKSAVDGYACMKEDLGTALKVVETIAAGVMPEKEITHGTCSRIMTGAAVPQGADYVFMFEDAEETEGDTVRFTGKQGNANIAKAAEDVMAGEILLRPGLFIRPQEIAVMAMTGTTMVTVSKRPVVGIISTGDELVEPGERPSGAMIRNSNGWQLLAQLSRAGVTGRYFGIAADSKEKITGMLTEALDSCDVVLISGGVSFGDFDFVPAVMKSKGLTIHFHQVAMQPGKPLTFSSGDRKAVFGLPGNPVSTFVQFEVMVRPFLDMMMGVRTEEPAVQLPLADDFSRKRAERMAFIPVTLTAACEVLPVEYHGSAHISSLSGAWGIVTIPKGQSWIQKGELVSVRQI